MNRLASLLVFALTLAAAPALAEQDFRHRISTDATASPALIAEDVKAEVAFGRDVAARILGRHRLFNDSELTRYVNLVGQAVAASADRPELAFHFAILDTEAVNAYAAPGGYIFVTRGALGQMRDEAELAAVLAHEVAHVSRRHIVKELRIRGAEKAPEAGLAHMLGGAGDPARVAFAQAVDKAVALLFESGLRRQDELECDRLGSLLLAQIGYDPAALHSYLARLQKQRGEPLRTLQNTHPAFDQRLALLDELLTAQHLAAGFGARAKKRFDSQTTSLEAAR